MSEKPPTVLREPLADASRFMPTDDIISKDLYNVTPSDHSFELKTVLPSPDTDRSAASPAVAPEVQVEPEAGISDEEKSRIEALAAQYGGFAPEVEAALEKAQSEVDKMTGLVNTTLKKPAVVRHALVELGVLEADTAKAMSDESVMSLKETMSIKYAEEYKTVYDLPDSPDSLTDAIDNNTFIIPDSSEPTPEVDPAVTSVDTANVDTASVAVVDTATDPVDSPAAAASPEAVVDAEQASSGDNEATERPGFAKKLKSFLTSKMHRERGRHREKKNRLSPAALAAMGATVLALTLTASIGGNDSNNEKVPVTDIAAEDTANSMDIPLVEVTEAAPEINIGTIGSAVLPAAPAVEQAPASAEMPAPVTTPVVEQTTTPVEVPPETLQAAPATEQAAPVEINFTAEVLEAAPGEGWINQLTQMGATNDEIPALLQKIASSTDPALKDWVYIMENGDPGISRPGQIPEDVLQSIQKLRNN